MKNILFVMLSTLLFVPLVFAEETNAQKIDVSLIKCNKSDSIFLEIDGKTEIVSLIAFDKGSGGLNKEIDDYICEKLKSSSLIQIEKDLALKDEYNRLPVWIYIDGNLLQEDLISKGYGQVNFIYDNYRYLDHLCELQKTPISKRMGIWSYSGIKEEFCNSGIATLSTHEKEVKEEKVDNQKLKDTLNYMLFLSSGMLLLVLLLVRRKR